MSENSFMKNMSDFHFENNKGSKNKFLKKKLKIKLNFLLF
jgi:hypothetical protein